MIKVNARIYAFFYNLLIGREFNPKKAGLSIRANC